MNKFSQYFRYSVCYLLVSQIIPAIIKIFLQVLFFGTGKEFVFKEAGFHISAPSLKELMSPSLLGVIFLLFLIELFLALGSLYFADAFIRIVIKSRS